MDQILFKSDYSGSPENFAQYQKEIETCAYALMMHGLSNTFFQTVDTEIQKITRVAPSSDLHFQLATLYKATRVTLGKLGAESIEGDWSQLSPDNTYDHQGLPNSAVEEYESLKSYPDVLLEYACLNVVASCFLEELRRFR